MVKQLAEKAQWTRNNEKQYISMYLSETNTVINILQWGKDAYGILWFLRQLLFNVFFTGKMMRISEPTQSKITVLPKRTDLKHCVLWNNAIAVGIYGQSLAGQRLWILNRYIYSFSIERIINWSVNT